MTASTGQPTAQARPKRTPARQKARQLAKHLRAERPACIYLKEENWASFKTRSRGPETEGQLTEPMRLIHARRRGA